MDVLVTNRFKDKSVDPPQQRQPNDFLIDIDEGFAGRLVAKNLGVIVNDIENYPWHTLDGRELCPLEKERSWKRVVACVNIWNDVESIKQTLPSWYDYVDHVIAVDGAYEGSSATHPFSTDGTLEYLKSLDKVEVVETTEFWPTQYEKRTEYFKRGREGDLMFVVDADEYVDNAEVLLSVSDFDVGWAFCDNTLYKRNQTLSRLYRWQEGLHYNHRHYWVFDGEGELVANRQKGGCNLDHRFVPLIYRNMGKDAPRSSDRKRHRSEIKRHQFSYEKKVGEEKPSGRESLRILQLTSIDPGMVVYRFHSAINTTTPHTSVMAGGRERGEFEIPYQFHMKRDRDIIRKAAKEADIIHCHLTYRNLKSLGIDVKCPVVIHHHGTMYRENFEDYNHYDKNNADLKLVSNFELLQYGDNLHYLPNPVPVARYRSLRKPIEDDKWCIGHSPTKRHLKGTEEFLEALKRLQEDGYNVEAVLIENKPHAESVRLKGTCDIFFDSFFLGVQCSGLEAACMGIPVVAGDWLVAGEYEKRLGQVPYTFADADTLYDELKHLITSKEYYNSEAKRVYDYVLSYHDYPVVAEQYLNLLDDAVNWKERHLLSNF